MHLRSHGPWRVFSFVFGFICTVFVLHSLAADVFQDHNCIVTCSIIQQSGAEIEEASPEPESVSLSLIEMQNESQSQWTMAKQKVAGWPVLTD